MLYHNTNTVVLLLHIVVASLRFVPQYFLCPSVLTVMVFTRKLSAH